jgi:hypothetical protein
MSGLRKEGRKEGRKAGAREIDEETFQGEQTNH